MALSGLLNHGVLEGLSWQVYIIGPLIVLGLAFVGFIKFTDRLVSTLCYSLQSSFVLWVTTSSLVRLTV